MQAVHVGVWARQLFERHVHQHLVPHVRGLRAWHLPEREHVYGGHGVSELCERLWRRSLFEWLVQRDDLAQLRSVWGRDISGHGGGSDCLQSLCVDVRPGIISEWLVHRQRDKHLSAV